MKKYRYYGIIFNNNCKVYIFKSEKDYQISEEVIVNTQNGEQFGKVVSIYDAVKDDMIFDDIIRLASKEERKKHQENLEEGIKAAEKCKEIVKKLKLEMYVINASFNLDKSQLLINFSADDRVDFRELAKKLASIYKTRIELRQIGARDKARQIGGIGICGQNLCCSAFLNHIESISMNKAKNQNLALNPSKINGACGRLLCCLCYEDEEYTRCSKGLKQIGSIIKYKGEEAKIINVDILSRKYKILLNDEKITIDAEDVNNVAEK
ncbi:MAG: stage 0 sporulation protein [Mollicutes bacterium]|nr:stage 0 sporulation protein [Mollicutes bacterium]